MRTGNAQSGVLDWDIRNVFRTLDRLLDGSDGFVEINNDAFARAARFRQSVPAVAQSVLGDFGDEDACLSAADVNRGQKMFGRLRHQCCPLAMAGLGFWLVAG